MTSSINHNVIADAKALTTDICFTSKDPIEKSLPRTSNRILGLVLGPLLLGMPATISLFDAHTDKEKLKKIDVKLLELKTTTLDKESLDFEKADASLTFQKDFYKNIAEYTQTARETKKIFAVGSLIFSIGSSILLASANYPKPSISTLDIYATLAVYTGLAIATPTALYGIYNNLVNGSTLNKTNYNQAEQLSKKLEV